MLYDYHIYQNAQKPNSVHATYLVFGKESSSKSAPDGDVEMSSSIPEEEEPLSETVPVDVLTLAREEQLKGSEAQSNLYGESSLTVVRRYSGWISRSFLHSRLQPGASSSA